MNGKGKETHDAAPPAPGAWLTIVGMGADGWAGLNPAARQAIAAAPVLFGGARHLALVPEHAGQERIPWPRPFDPAYTALLARRGTPVCALASGDPMFYGIGGRLGALLSPGEWRVLAAPSSLSLAAARCGWALEEVRVFAAHRQPLAALRRALNDGDRWFVFSADGQTPARLAAWLCAHDFGPSQLRVFEHLGGPEETCRTGIAATWAHANCAVLNLVALIARADAGYRPLSRRCGLPDDAYEHDGQLTKRDVRAAVLARLAPLPGELLWDVGAGCGSIGIEWLRAEPSARAFAIEADPVRRQLIERNAQQLGVPELAIIAGRAPEALTALPAPDAIFIGGGLNVPGVIENCWDALKPGGRLVANAVTLQSETSLFALRARIGGELTRLEVAQAAPLGRFDVWRGALPITLLTVPKPRAAH